MPRLVKPQLTFKKVFGQLGPEVYVTGHHTAGPKDKTDTDAIRLATQYHRDHAAKGWGGIGYHYMIARSGTILLLRPLTLKGAHVGGHNSNNVGVVCNGTTGDRPTLAQAASFNWLLRNAHTTNMPRSHRTDRPLSRAAIKGHNDWTGHESNACPGTHRTMYKTKGHAR